MNVKKEIEELKQQIQHLQHMIEVNPGLRTVHVGDNMAMVRLKYGPLIYVDTRDTTMSMHMMQKGEWETAYSDLVRKLVNEGDVFVDVGANYGYYSAIAGWQIGLSGKLYSFEPNPSVFKYLQKTLKANGFYIKKIVKSFQVGLSDFEGVSKFSFLDGDFGGGSMYIPENRIKKENFKVIDVDISTMDKLLSDVDSLDFVKIDAEGAEVGIINGMKKLINRSPNIKILMEFYPNHITTHTTVEEFVNELLNLGFHFYRPLLHGELEMISPQNLISTTNCYILMSKIELPTK